MLKKSAFTLIEVLVVVAILALLTLAAIVSFGGSRDKADDSRVKSDLDRLKIAFEDYYSDHNCYPPLEWFDSTADCGSDHLQPYLNVMPCNRKTGLPYTLRKDATGCTWFKLYGTITNPTDPKYYSFTEGSTLLGTYAVSSSNINPYPDLYPNPDSTYYYCIGISTCTDFNPSTKTCTPSWENAPECDRVGGSGPFCQTAGSCTPL